MPDFHFSISDYTSSAVDGLILWLIGCAVVCVMAVKDTVVSLWRKRAEFRIMSVRKKAWFLLRKLRAVVGVLIFLIITVWPTAKYSMYLPFESTEDAIYTSGEIDHISAVACSPRYSIGNDSTPYFASIVSVGGEKYYFLTADGLKEGMTIEINYLPRSHMVLDCISNEVIDIAENPAPSAEEQSQEQDSPLLYIIATVVLCILIVAAIVYIIIIKRRIKRRKITGL